MGDYRVTIRNTQSDCSGVAAAVVVSLNSPL